MKKFISFLVIILSFANIFAQTTKEGLEKLVNTEKSFAKTAAEKNTKEAFLTFLADDGVLFNPTVMNGKEFWAKRPTPIALLAWTPEFADISSNGVLGYTTGPWEFRPKGKDDAPAAYGHYVTLWQRQSDGNFKIALDFGISHDKVNLVENWTAPNDTGKELNENKFSAADASTQFFETAEKEDINKAYKMFAAEDIRLYRDGKIPFLGRKNALEAIKKNKSTIKFAKRSVFVSAADLAYINNTYTLFDKDGNESEKGNFLQIWKLRNKKWQIVLDLFKPLPTEKK